MKSSGGSGDRKGGFGCGSPRITYHTHALPRCHEGRNADQKQDRSQDAPGARRAANGHDRGGDEPAQDTAYTESAGKDDARPVAVADGPTDEVRVGLATEGRLHRMHDRLEGRRVGRGCKGADEDGALLRG
jgi:hypothetical protein